MFYVLSFCQCCLKNKTLTLNMDGMRSPCLKKDVYRYELEFKKTEACCFIPCDGF